MAPRVLVFGAWDEGPGYPRARSLIDALASLPLQVRELRFTMPAGGRARQELARQPWRWPWALLRSALVRRQGIAALRREIGRWRPDVVVLPYPGHLLAPAVRRAYRGPLLLDLFLSAHDTVVVDRELAGEASVAARLLRRLDRRACRSADRVLLDTAEHAARLASSTGLPAARFDWLPVGEPGRDPAPMPLPAPPPAGEPATLLFFGTGVPLHGLDVLVDAVARVPDLHLHLIGGRDADREHARARLGARVRVDARFVEPLALRSAMRRAHLVAGVFGASPKAQLVVPFKVMHALAAGRPIVTADTPAVRGMLRVGDEVCVAPAGDAAALATVLAELVASPHRWPALAAGARAAYERGFSLRARAARLAGILEPWVEVAAPQAAVPEPAEVAR